MSIDLPDSLSPVSLCLRIEVVAPFLILGKVPAFCCAIAFAVLNTLAEARYSRSDGFWGRIFLLAKWAVFNAGLLCVALVITTKWTYVSEGQTLFAYDQLVSVAVLTAGLWVFLVIWRSCPVLGDRLLGY